MPDIALRFHKDMLVLSSPASSALDRLGVDVARDLELTTLLEPDTLEDIYKLEAMAGAQCFVANTASFTPARLAHSGFEDRAEDLAKISLSVLRQFKPQHVLVEIGPCGLPLDPSSKASLVENRDQYSRAARLFEGMEFDAFFLNGFKNCDDLMCALIGIRKVSDALVFASVDVDEEGVLVDGRKKLLDAVAIMAEYGACTVGFSTPAGQDAVCAMTRELAQACDLPILVQLEVRERSARQQGPTTENPYYCADAMMPAADALHAAGAQFLRAAGDATPAYTGALMATVLGTDVKIGL